MLQISIMAKTSREPQRSRSGACSSLPGCLPERIDRGNLTRPLTDVAACPPLPRRQGLLRDRGLWHGHTLEVPTDDRVSFPRLALAAVKLRRRRPPVVMMTKRAWNAWGK